jgi:hypothetical protein
MSSMGFLHIQMLYCGRSEALWKHSSALMGMHKRRNGGVMQFYWQLGKRQWMDGTKQFGMLL